MMSAALWLGYWASATKEWYPSEDALVALLLIIPSGVAWLVARGEVSRVLEDATVVPRTALWIQALIGVVAAASIALEGPSRVEVEMVWSLLAVGSSMTAMLVLVNAIQTLRLSRVRPGSAIQ
jgi:hypothetical protein